MSLSTRNGIPVVPIEGLPFSAYSMSQVVSYVADHLREGRGGWIVTPNLDILRRWRRDPDFRQLVEPATIFTPDGMPILWLSRILGHQIHERVSGSDLFSEFCGVCAQNGWSVFFLGGNPGTAANARTVIQSRFPQLVVSGVHSPPFGFEKDAAESQAISSKLAAAKPDVVFVGLGSPKQEELIARLMPAFPNAWWAGIGITFSFICGDMPRAPIWMRGAGLEWLHRLLQEPRRLFRRYLIDGGPFLVGTAVRCLRLRLAEGSRLRSNQP